MNLPLPSKVKMQATGSEYDIQLDINASSNLQQTPSEDDNINIYEAEMTGNSGWCCDIL